MTLKAIVEKNAFTLIELSKCLGFIYSHYISYFLMMAMALYRGMCIYERSNINIVVFTL